MTFSNETFDELLPEFDPTNPDADYGDVVRVGGDAILNAVTFGSAGNAFSEASQGIESLNEFTDNAFTAESLEEAVEDFVPIIEETGEVISNVVENLFGGLW